jgi:hypothetical protein
VFIEDRLFNMDKVDDTVCSAIIQKINSGDYKFTEQEILVMRSISNIGDVCTCDTDHRIGRDNKACAFSQV